MNLQERLRFYQSLFDKAEAKGKEQVSLVWRELCRRDLFFLLRFGCGRKDIEKEWLYDRCNEVNDNPDGCIDLWSREHYKSTIITFGKTIQDILNDPETTCGIFSHTRPIAKAFLRQIKRELEGNDRLKGLFPDILYLNPQQESPKWSEDDGIIVKRRGNPNAATVEAWGLVDSQPTSKHFKLIIFDDVVTKDSVTSPEMIQKTTEAWELALNLSMDGGKIRYIGTRYHYNDTYATIMARNSAIPRLYPGTKDGTAEGEPVLWSYEYMAGKRKSMGGYVFACLAGDTLITMGDLSHKPIEDVMVGDYVVGWSKDKNKRTRLKRTKVLAIQTNITEAIESVMENGDVLRHTPNHRWWTGRAFSIDKNGRERAEYVPLGFNVNGGGHQKGACKAFDLSFLNKNLIPTELVAVGYLAGIIDGEGGVEHKTLQITQDIFLHPDICERIEWSLKALGFDYGICDRDRRDAIERKHHGIRRVELKEQRNIGKIKVYNIQTETGNYIANGYCSKNCQILQNPKQDVFEGFEDTWLQFWPASQFKGMNTYVFCDPASSKKKGSDYTVFMLIGGAADKNYYIISMVRDRLNLVERANVLFKWHRDYRPKGVYYEKYGLMSDIEHYQTRMNAENYRFRIQEVGGRLAKTERIKALIPLFEQGKIFMPESCIRTDYERKQVDLVKIFINDEYKAFPFCAHDDMLDCLARIADPDVHVAFPGFSDAWSSNDKQTIANLLGNANQYNPLTFGVNNLLNFEASI